MARDLTDAEAKAVRSLKRVAKTWPETLWLFSASGTLCVMVKGEDGDRMRTPDGMGFDSSGVAETVKIENDGGDW